MNDLIVIHTIGSSLGILVIILEVVIHIALVQNKKPPNKTKHFTLLPKRRPQDTQEFYPAKDRDQDTLEHQVYAYKQV